MVPPLRSTSSFSTPSNPSTPDPLRPSFEIDSKSRSYKQQYANLYWLRLAVLRAKVEKRARGLWEGMEGESKCWIVGGWEGEERVYCVKLELLDWLHRLVYSRME